MRTARKILVVQLWTDYPYSDIKMIPYLVDLRHSKLIRTWAPPPQIPRRLSLPYAALISSKKKKFTKHLIQSFHQITEAFALNVLLRQSTKQTHSITTVCLVLKLLFVSEEISTMHTLLINIIYAKLRIKNIFLRTGKFLEHKSSKKENKFWKRIKCVISQNCLKNLEASQIFHKSLGSTHVIKARIAHNFHKFDFANK